MTSRHADTQASQAIAVESRRSSWAPAVIISLSLHALLVWAVSNAARPTSIPAERFAPLTVYMLPPPSPPEELPIPELQPAPEPERAEPEPEEPPAAIDEPARNEQPLPPAEPATEAPTDGPRRFRYAEPVRRSIDWNALISRAVTRLREEQAPTYRSFGFPEPQPSDSRPRAATEPQIGEIVRLGGPAPQQAEISENCYYDVYLPGSPLEEAHRFSNSMVSCKAGADPEEARNDLFLDAKPPYLD